MPTRMSNSAARSAAQDFHALDGVDVAVQVAHLQADIAQVIGEILRGALGERGDEHALLRFSMRWRQSSIVSSIWSLSGWSVIFGIEQARSGG